MVITIIKEMDTDLDLTSFGDNILGEGKNGRWVSSFIVSYCLDEDPKEYQDQMEWLLPKERTLETYVVESKIHFLIRVKRILIGQTGYFAFSGKDPEIRLIRNDSEWLLAKQMLSSRAKTLVTSLETTTPKKVTVWTINPLEASFSKEDEALLKERAKAFNSLVESYRPPSPKKKEDLIAVKSVPTKKPRQRLVVVNASGRPLK